MNTAAKIDDRQDEIGDRPGRDDRGALADRLEEEALAPLGLAHVADAFRLSGTLAAFSSPKNLT